MHTLSNWKARRAGGRITVTGTDAVSGEARKIVGVDRIEPSNRPNAMCVLAFDLHGNRHTLAI